jgi:hypothetical protein
MSVLGEKNMEEMDRFRTGWTGSGFSGIVPQGWGLDRRRFCRLFREFSLLSRSRRVHILDHG